MDVIVVLFQGLLYLAGYLVETLGWYGRWIAPIKSIISMFKDYEHGDPKAITGNLIIAVGGFLIGTLFIHLGRWVQNKFKLS